jgi:GNAT superfamily N-acetyltransferase
MLTISTVRSVPQIAAARDLLREYLEWVLTLEEHSRDAPTFHEIGKEVASLPGIYSPPAGRLLLATNDSRVAGCIALKPYAGPAGEIKRFYVRTAFRGLGIGRALVGAAIQAARHVGYERLVLDSHISMTGAHGIYRKAGFRTIETPDDFPAHLKPVVVFMECDLRQ